MAPAASSPATAGGTAPGAEQDDHGGEDDERPLRPSPEQDRLAAHELRPVDDEQLRASSRWLSLPFVADYGSPAVAHRGAWETLTQVSVLEPAAGTRPERSISKSVRGMWNASRTRSVSPRSCHAL
jgi:hypothetical protein